MPRHHHLQLFNPMLGNLGMLDLEGVEWELEEGEAGSIYM